MYKYRENETTNHTGIPDKMKKEFEERSGVPLDNVRVYRNSRLPERYGALAFSKGNSIYLKSGEERYLAHEVVHQIQAAQGMVKEETRIDGEAFNQNPTLEEEAERGIVHAKPPMTEKKPKTIQRKIGMEFQTYGGNWNIKKLKKLKKPENENENKDDETLIEEFKKCAKETGNVFGMLESAGRDMISNFSTTDGYQVTADGSDLEYITNAFDETEAGKAGLVSAVEKAAEEHKKYTKADPSTLIARKYHCISGEDGVYCVNRDGEKTAHPQATVGIKFEKIPDLIKRITEASKGDILYQEQKEEIRRNIVTARECADSAVAPGGVKEPEKCRAWIALVEEYISAANSRIIRDNGKKKKEIAAIEALKNEVFLGIEKANQLWELREGSWEDMDINVGRDRVRQAAESELLFLDNREKSERLKQELKEIDKKCRVLLDTRGKIDHCEKQIEEKREQREKKEQSLQVKEARMIHITQQIDALQGKKGGARLSNLLQARKMLEGGIRGIKNDLQKLQETVSRLTGELEKLQETSAALLGELAQKWTDFKRDGNVLIREIKAAAKEKEEDWPEYQEEGRDSYVYLTWYYHNLMEYIDAWPQINNFPKWRGMIRDIKENSPVNSERYFKTLLPVKSRTSFYDLYMLLEPADQAYVLNYIETKYPRDTLIEEDKTNCTTLWEWLDAMKGKVRYRSGRRDIVNYELENGVVAGRGTYDYKAAFGVSRSTDIGHDSGGKRVEGALLELRRLKDKILPKDWVQAAKDVADIVAEVNKEEQKPPAVPEPKLTIPVVRRAALPTVERRTVAQPVERRTVAPPVGRRTVAQPVERRTVVLPVERRTVAPPVERRIPVQPATSLRRTVLPSLQSGLQ